MSKNDATKLYKQLEKGSSEVLASNPQWILSSDCSGGGCCVPIAMVNALEFWECPHPVPDTLDWEIMIEIASCRHGSAIGIDRTADWLGVVLSPRGERDIEEGPLPLELSVHDLKLGLHSILMVARKDDEVYVINYRGEGGQWVKRSELELVHKSKLVRNVNVTWIVPRWKLLAAHGS
jgi:hypothetical protein